MNPNRSRTMNPAMRDAARMLSEPLEQLVVETLEASMARIADPARADLPVELQPACAAALERLWCSRSALARAVLRPPLLRAPVARHRPKIDPAAIDLDIETERVALRFRDATEAEHHETQLAPPESGGSDAPPPPWALVSPIVCASVLRWAIERSLPVPAARRPLLRIVADELVERLPGLLRDAGNTGPSPQASRPLPLPKSPTIGDIQPGQWFRLYMNGEWIMTRLSWRSSNGHFFLFNSNSGGRTHSLSLRSLKRMASEELIAAVPLPAPGVTQRDSRPRPA